MIWSMPKIWISAKTAAISFYPCVCILLIFSTLFRLTFFSNSFFIQFFLIGMLISVPFIIVTLLVYGCIPKLQNLYGKCLMCYLISLATSYITLSWTLLYSWQWIQTQICYFIGYLTYFSFLSALLWLNVMNFDLWLSFQLVECMLNFKDFF